ncbi:MAG: amidohydrolase [Acidobacteria bacterium]|nr:amidohydrolase [Acidobacteriota bacterium]
MKPRWILLLAAAAPLMAAPPVVVRNANVLTVTKGRFVGSILIRDGKIAEAGEKIRTPEGAQVIDASGQYVMPGIIDNHSHIAAESTNEGSVSVSSMVDIRDVLNPEDIAIYRALAGGVTTILTTHGSANAIGGVCSALKMRWGKDAAGLMVDGSAPVLKMALGENPKRRGGATQFGGNITPRYPATRMGVEDVIREAFTEAQAYRQTRRDYEAKLKRGEKAAAPRRDIRLDPLVEVLEGRCLVHVHAYRADETLMMLRLAQEFGFRVHALIHVLEGYKVAKEIAAHNAGATTFSDWWAYKMEAADAIPYNAALMHRKGVLVALNSDSPELMRHLNQEAAKAIKYGGVTEDEALAMITINPARQIGLDQRVGSIEPGKDADLVIYDKHPLSNYAKVQKVLIEGEVYFDRDRDVSQREERESRRKALVEKAKEQQKKAGPPGTRRPS